MSGSTKLLTPANVQHLLERLSLVPAIAKFDQPGEPQAATLAHAFSDLEDSFRMTLDVLIPKLLDRSLEPAALNDVLFDIGEELRHVLYHIRDPRFFAYLFEDEI